MVTGSTIFQVSVSPEGLVDLEGLTVLFGLGGMEARDCQIGMQGPQLCPEPCHFCKFDVATSRMAFLDLNLHGLQVNTSNSNN